MALWFLRPPIEHHKKLLGIVGGTTHCVLRPTTPDRFLNLAVFWILPLLPLTTTGCTNPSGSASEPSPTPIPQSLPPTLLTPSSTTIDLGFVAQAGHAQEIFSLSNPGTKPIEIAKVTTSCDCLDIRLPKHLVEPGEKVLVRALLDLTKEPQFLGGLAIEVKGLTPTGEVAFSIVVEVTVRPKLEFDKSNLPAIR